MPEEAEKMKIFLLILCILLVLICFLLVYLIVSPVQVQIDSTKGIYWAGWNRWFCISLVHERNNWRFKIKLFFWKKYYSVERLFLRKPSKRKRKPKSKKRKRKAFTAAKARKLFKSIKIRELIFNLDTEDVIWNARLYPIATLLSVASGHPFRINFQGKNLIRIKAESRLINILKAGYL